MKLPKSSQRWRIPSIPDVPSHTLASHRCYQNQLSDQLVSLNIAIGFMHCLFCSHDYVENQLLFYWAWLPCETSQERYLIDGFKLMSQYSLFTLFCFQEHRVHMSWSAIFYLSCFTAIRWLQDSWEARINNFCVLVLKLYFTLQFCRQERFPLHQLQLLQNSSPMFIQKVNYCSIGLDYLVFLRRLDYLVKLARTSSQFMVFLLSICMHV